MIEKPQLKALGNDVTNNLVEKIVRLAPDQKIVGRIRLQKVFYLLKILGLKTDFNFKYYHYGPYSDSLSGAVLNSVVEGSLRENFGTTQYGSRFSIFETPQSGHVSIDELQGLSEEDIASAIRIMVKTSSVVIELAATIHWLREQEKVSDWLTELKARKPEKVSDARIEAAERLLIDLGI